MEFKGAGFLKRIVLGLIVPITIILSGYFIFSQGSLNEVYVGSRLLIAGMILLFGGIVFLILKR